MLTIVTGKQNSGKTSYMIDHYESTCQGDGFVAVKHFDGEQITGFSARRLSTGETRLFAQHDCVRKSDFDETCRIGPYGFSGTTLAWISSTIVDLIEQAVEPVYLDEIGKLEVSGHGLDAAFRCLLKQPIEVVISVREDWLDTVLKHYNIQTYQRINL